MLGLGTGIELMDRAGQEYSAPNYSLSLDGTADYVQLTPTTGFNIKNTGNNISISFWAKRTDNSDEAVVLGLASTGSGSRLNFDSNGTNLVIESDGYNQLASGAVTADTYWHHYVVTIQGVDSNLANVAIYEDGAAVTVTNAAGFGNSAAQMTIDRIGDDNASGTEGFKGLLYQVAMWHAILDADAVAAIYGSGTPIPLQEDKGSYDNASDLFHLWRFEEGSGTIAADTNSHILHDMPGTLVNDAAFSTGVPTDDL